MTRVYIGSIYVAGVCLVFIFALFPYHTTHVCTCMRMLASTCMCTCFSLPLSLSLSLSVYIYTLWHTHTYIHAGRRTDEGNPAAETTHVHISSTPRPGLIITAHVFLIGIYTRWYMHISTYNMCTQMHTHGLCKGMQTKCQSAFVSLFWYVFHTPLERERVTEEAGKTKGKCAFRCL